MSKMVVTEKYLDEFLPKTRKLNSLPHIFFKQSLDLRRTKINKENLILKNNRIGLDKNIKKLNVTNKFIRNKKNIFDKKKKEIKNCFKNSFNTYCKTYLNHNKIPKNTRMSNHSLMNVLEKFPKQENRIMGILEISTNKLNNDFKKLISVFSKHKSKKIKYNLLRKKVKVIRNDNFQKKMDFIDKTKYDFKNLGNKSFTSNKNFEKIKKKNEKQKKFKNMNRCIMYKKSWKKIKLSKNKNLKPIISEKILKLYQADKVNNFIDKVEI